MSGAPGQLSTELLGNVHLIHLHCKFGTVHLTHIQGAPVPCICPVSANFALFIYSVDIGWDLPGQWYSLRSDAEQCLYELQSQSL